MMNRLIKGFYDFIKPPLLASLILIPPVIGFSEYNRSNVVENEVFNFRYKGMEAKVVKADYPLTGNMNHILLEDGSKISQGNIISDNGDTVVVYNGYYFINGVEQK